MSNVFIVDFTTVLQFISFFQHHVVFYECYGHNVFMFKSQADIVMIPDHEILKVKKFFFHEYVVEINIFIIIICFVDLKENLVESKHHKLARSIRSGVSDRDLKPNAIVRDALNTIVGYPPTTQLSVEEQDLVWKFRFYLSNQKKVKNSLIAELNIYCKFISLLKFPLL